MNNLSLSKEELDALAEMLAKSDTGNGVKMPEINTPQSDSQTVSTQSALRRQEVPAQEQQGEGMNPMDAYRAYEKFSGNSLFGGGNAGTYSGAEGIASSELQTTPFFELGGDAAGSVGSGSGGGGAAGGKSFMASAGPWAALAGAIAGNEYFARQNGRRPDSNTARFRDALSGRSMTTDMDYYADKVGGAGGEAMHHITKGSTPEGILDIFGIKL